MQARPSPRSVESPPVSGVLAPPASFPAMDIGTSQRGPSRPSFWWRTPRDAPQGPARHDPISIAEVVAEGWNLHNSLVAHRKGPLLVACLLWTTGIFDAGTSDSADLRLRLAPGFLFDLYYNARFQDPTVFCLPRVCRWTWRSLGRIACLSCSQIRQPRQFRGNHGPPWHGLRYSVCDFCLHVGVPDLDEVDEEDLRAESQAAIQDPGL